MIGFIVGILHFQEVYDYIWVIVDKSIECVHFLSIKTTYFIDKYTKLRVDEIIQLHGALVSIVADRDSRFIS